MSKKIKETVQDSDKIACNCGNRFIKSIHFKKIDVPNEVRLNKRMKSEFAHFLNCYAYRDMDYLKKYSSLNVIYCHIDLSDSHDLYICGNKYLIKDLKSILEKFDNVEHLYTD